MRKLFFGIGVACALALTAAYAPAFAEEPAATELTCEQALEKAKQDITNAQSWDDIVLAMASLGFEADENTFTEKFNGDLEAARTGTLDFLSGLQCVL